MMCTFESVWMCSVVFPGILRDETMNDKLICISNDDKQNYPFCTIKLLVYKSGHFLFRAKFNKIFLS